MHVVIRMCSVGGGVCHDGLMQIGIHMNARIQIFSNIMVAL